MGQRGPRADAGLTDVSDRVRTAPAGLTLPVPWHVRWGGAAAGVGTVLLGLVYLLVPPPRPGTLAQSSTIAILEPYLGWAMVLIGTGVVVAAGIRAGRASAHLVAAVAHGVYLLALVATFVFTDPNMRPTVASVLSWFALIVHAVVSADYWQRGHR